MPEYGTKQPRSRACCRYGDASGPNLTGSPVAIRHATRQLVEGRRGAYFMGGETFGGPMPEVTAAASMLSRPLVIAAAVAGLLVAGTMALWLHYGTAVFYEMILAGIALCF